MGRFISIHDAIKLRMLGNDDILQRSKGRLLSWSKYVYQDLNLSSLKIARRELFEINKLTNTVDIPRTSTGVISVDVIDSCGVIHPVWENDRLHDDIVDVSAKKNCACEFECGYSLCNTIKGYEVVKSTKTIKDPDGNILSFDCLDRIAVDNQGFLYRETQYPINQFISGVYSDTVLLTESEKLCKVETDGNGCVCDTNANLDAVCSACGLDTTSGSNVPVGGSASTPPNTGDKTWIYWCSNKLDWFSVQCGCYAYSQWCPNPIYNISELGDRLIFPANFGYDKVLVRWYEDVNLKDMVIPMIAVDVFVMGLMWWDARFNDKKQKLAVLYEGNYSKGKFGLLQEFNKYRVAELRMIATPPVWVPSYNSDREHE